MNRQEIISKIRSHLFENFIFGYKDDELCNTDSFLRLGILDSMGIMELVCIIEREFAISVTNSDIIPEHFDSVNNLTDYVLKKRDEK